MPFVKECCMCYYLEYNKATQEHKVDGCFFGHCMVKDFKDGQLERFYICGPFCCGGPCTGNWLISPIFVWRPEAPTEHPNITWCALGLCYQCHRSPDSWIDVITPCCVSIKNQICCGYRINFDLICCGLGEYKFEVEEISLPPPAQNMH